jgi:hypothetical protein
MEKVLEGLVKNMGVGPFCVGSVFVGGYRNNCQKIWLLREKLLSLQQLQKNRY